MDYLDPKKKKAKKKKILIMYVLLGIAISIATLIMLYVVNGYSIDRETGQVIQNALVYVDTKPKSAEIYLNGEKQRGKTDARLVLAEGTYRIDLKRDGYRDWSREVDLEGGSLRRLTYARLVPTLLETETVVSFDEMPTFVTQSPDKRWVVMGIESDALRFNVLDLQRQEQRIQSFGLPANTVNTTKKGSWTIIEWADDNRTFLARFDGASGAEYVLINRQNPERSKRIAATFSSIKFTTASLRNKKNDLLYLHDAKSGRLYQANATSGVAELALEGVLQYVSYKDNQLLYVSKKEATKGKVAVFLKRGDQEYTLRNITEDKSYLLALSEVAGVVVVGVSAPVENRAIVYMDPIRSLSQNDFSSIPVPTSVLQVNKPSELAISPDSSVIVVRGARAVVSHEFEADMSYRFVLSGDIDEKYRLKWVDGQHFLVKLAKEKGMLFSDFDWSNQYTITNTVASLGGFFDKDLEHFYTFTPPTKQEKEGVLRRTFMLSAADR